MPEDMAFELHRLTIVSYVNEAGEEVVGFGWANEGSPSVSQTVGLLEITKHIVLSEGDNV